MSTNESKRLVYDQDTWVKIEDIAKIFDISITSARQVKAMDYFKAVGRSQYGFIDSMRGYLNYKLDRPHGGGKPRTSKAVEEGGAAWRKLEAEADYKEAKAQMAKLELAEFEGRMHRSEDVKSVMEDLVYGIRSNLLALPGRVAIDCASAGSAAEVSEIIKREVYMLMDDLAHYSYDPQKFKELVLERTSWSEVEDAEEEEEQRQ